jgi:hypothetical protein
MYKDKVSTKMSKIFLLSMCDVKVFLTFGENCENRNDPDLVQAFLKKWWVESDFKAPNLPLSLRLKVSGCHYNNPSFPIFLYHHIT